MPGIVTEPAPTVLVNSLGDFSVILEVRFCISPPDRREAVEAQDQVLEAIKRSLTAAGIEMPFPTQHITIDGGLEH